MVAERMADQGTDGAPTDSLRGRDQGVVRARATEPAAVLKARCARLTLFRLRHRLDGSVSSANAEIRPDDCTDDAEGCRREGDNVLAPASAVWQLTQCERHYPEQGGEAESCNDYASHGVVPGFVPT